MSIKKKIGKKLNGLVRRSHWFNEELFPDCQKFWKYNTFNTDVINLGSTSGCHAFDYEGLEIRGGNFALRSNPLSADQAILKNYFSYLNPKGSYLILSLCVFSSISGSCEIWEDRFYTLLSPLSIPHFSYRRQQKVKNVAASPLRQFPLLSLYSELKGLLRPKKSHAFTEEQMEIDAERWIRGWKHEFALSDFSLPLSLINQDGVNDAAEILNDIISFCKERNIKPVIMIPPMYHTLAEKFDEKARQLFVYDLIEKIEDKTVPFYNYMDDSRFSRDSSLFMNSFFLNKKGAKKFTRIALTDIGLLH